MPVTKVAKIFKNGSSQAVRLPSEFRFSGTQVYATRDEVTGDVTLSDKAGSATWADFFEFMKSVDVPDNFMAERPLNAPPEDRDLFWRRRMIRYMLDTDTASYVIKGRPAEVRLRLSELDPSHVSISVITRAELMYGLKGLPPDHRLQIGVRQFFKTINIIPWTVEAADFYADIRHQLSTERKQIGQQDMMIAAHSLAAAVTLVTNNTRHYTRIAAPLFLENWVTAPE